MQKKNQKGFTLIELLVVISIIALLSSIVLAALQDAKNRADTRMRRQSMMEFVKALELYRTDMGYYPYEAELATNNFIAYYTTVRRPGAPSSFNSDPANLPDLGTLLQKYIPQIPRPRAQMFMFIRSKLDRDRCWGDTKPSPYIIVISSSNPGFEDWQYGQSDGEIETSVRCFSIK